MHALRPLWIRSSLAVVLAGAGVALVSWRLSAPERDERQAQAHIVPIELVEGAVDRDSDCAPDADEVEELDDGAQHLELTITSETPSCAYYSVFEDGEITL